VAVRAATVPGAPVRVRSSDGLIAARLVDRGPASATVALVAQGAVLLGGDHVVLSVDIADGISLRLVDVGGTVAYDGAGAGSRWDVEVRLGVGARLTWAGLPLVVATGADVVRTTTARLGAGSRLLLRETTVLGRSGESGGRLAMRSAVHDDAGPVLVEELAADGSHPVPGILGGHRVLDTVSDLYGAPIDEDPPPHRPLPAGRDLATLHLDRGGTLVRWLGPATHSSPLHHLDLDQVEDYPEES
jgi:urease accessory protein